MRLGVLTADCTAPDDRGFVQELPAPGDSRYRPPPPTSVGIRRRSRGDLRRGSRGRPRRSALTIEGLRRLSVPVVALGAGENYQGFRPSFR
jgi:hypothetical protein